MVSNKLNALTSFGLGMLLLCSCSNSHEERMAKLKSDHISKYQQELAQQQDSLRWADSVLVEITPLINDMIAQGKFEFVKNEFDELGRFVAKGSDAESNIGRSYLHATVNEYGVCQLISEYRGNGAFNHTQICVMGSDGSQQSSAIVPLEKEGANYRFQNQGTYHETVTFVADSTLAYIDLHVGDKKLKCVQINAKGKKNPILLSSKEVEQISNTYRLGKALALQLRCTQTSKVASQKITLLKSKLETPRQ